MPSSRRVAVLLKGLIGDAVMAVPLLEGLRAENDVWVLAPIGVRDVLGPAWSDRFVAHRKGFLSPLRALRSTGADVAVVLNRSFRSALVAWTAKVPLRIGHVGEGRGFLLTDRVPFDWRRHELESYLELGVRLGCGIEPAWPRLEITPAERARGKDMLEGRSVILQPGASRPYKELPTTALISVVRAVQARGERVALVGGPEEADAADKFAAAAIVPCLNLVGKTTLRETMGVLASARIAIGSDTGVMHLAAAVGCPTVTVFGPKEQATRWGHLHPPHQVIQVPRQGMASLNVDDLLSAVDAVLSPVGTP